MTRHIAQLVKLTAVEINAMIRTLDNHEQRDALEQGLRLLIDSPREMLAIRFAHMDRLATAKRRGSFKEITLLHRSYEAKMLLLGYMLGAQHAERENTCQP